MDKIAYTVNEVAQALGVCKATVRKVIHSGDLEAVRAGRKLLIPVAALKAFIASGGTKQAE